jgi:hypothetical protein
VLPSCCGQCFHGGFLGLDSKDVTLSVKIVCIFQAVTDVGTTATMYFIRDRVVAFVFYE